MHRLTNETNNVEVFINLKNHKLVPCALLNTLNKTQQI